jgi:hypothetical protein
VWRDLAEWLDRLAVNAKVATILGSGHIGIRGVADEAVLNNVQKKSKKSPFLSIGVIAGVY